MLRINFKILLGLTSISSRMSLVLGNNAGHTASFSRREHCLTKKSLKIVVFVDKDVILQKWRNIRKIFSCSEVY